MIRNALVRWYKRQASLKIREKVKRYAPIVGVEPAGVNIKTFKSRWGSCTAKGELEFNWLIMLAPNRMVDYVVIHELCHLIHHDHSPEFWREVMRVMPDYQQCREWLRENSEGVGGVSFLFKLRWVLPVSTFSFTHFGTPITDSYCR